MKNKKLIGTVLGVMILGTILTGCGKQQTNDQTQAQQTEQIQQQSNAKLGMPNIKNFYEKQVLKQVMEAADNSNLVTYAYLQSSLTGKLEYLGQAIGYAVPYGTEYTNPSYIANSFQSGYAILPQADPNGLWKAQNVNATWLMLIDPTTKKATPIYCEPNLIVSQFKLPKTMIDPSTLPSDY